eukprot:12404865-Karenia_brevis.AAC.1
MKKLYDSNVINNGASLDFPQISSERPLTVKDVQDVFGISKFTAYQVLGDFGHLTSEKLIFVKIDDLGTGALKLGDTKLDIDWEHLLGQLNDCSQFRFYYEGRISLLGLGHLMCETRQNVAKSSMADFLALGAGEKTGEDRMIVKRGAAVAIAEYAIEDKKQHNMRHI